MRAWLGLGLGFANPNPNPNPNQACVPARVGGCESSAARKRKRRGWRSSCSEMATSSSLRTWLGLGLGLGL